MIARIESALAFISATERETWLMAGMAIKGELGDGGYDLWDIWSQQADSYNSQSSRSVWRSIRSSGKITVGSLFHEARSNGWRDDGHKPSREQIEERKRQSEYRATLEGQEREKAQEAASKKAGWILKQCKMEQHAYLDSKGFKEALGAVWWPDESNNLLCLPMRVNNDLAGIQMIDRLGAKKFLSGQRTVGAEYLINNDGYGADDWYVEGYASGLSLRECLKALRLRYRIHICFSAHNLQSMAKASGRGFIVADNDASGAGEKAAVGAGLPYYLPPMLGTDINDLHKSQGTFKTSQALRKWINENKK
jgi:putative DNA primase/helicase